MRQNRTVSHTKKLKTERVQTLLRLARLREALRSEVDPDADEGDPDVVEQEKAMALMQNLERKLASIDCALRRAQNGTYGICERCGQRIDPARLEAVPETILCLQCKMITERETRMSAIPVRV
jgi:RNA polymerase-binding protein DksA